MNFLVGIGAGHSHLLQEIGPELVAGLSGQNANVAAVNQNSDHLHLFAPYDAKGPRGTIPLRPFSEDFSPPTGVADTLQTYQQKRQPVKTTCRTHRWQAAVACRWPAHNLLRITAEAVCRMREKTPLARGQRLIDALLAWLTPDRGTEARAQPLLRSRSPMTATRGSNFCGGEIGFPSPRPRPRSAGHRPLNIRPRSPSWISPRQPLPGGARRHRAAYADVPRPAPNGDGALRWWRCRRGRRFPQLAPADPVLARPLDDDSGARRLDAAC